MISWSMGNLKKTMLVVGIVGIITGFFQVDTWVELRGDLSAGIAFVGAPLHMLFTGAFYPPDAQEARKGRDQLKFLVQKEQWVFKYDEVKNLGSTVGESEILLAIRPFNISVTGPEDLIKSLGAPDIIGKPVRLKGYLYPNNRRFVLQSIEGVKKESR